MIRLDSTHMSKDLREWLRVIETLGNAQINLIFGKPEVKSVPVCAINMDFRVNYGSEATNI